MSEEDVIRAIQSYLGFNGIVLHRIRERVPRFKDRFGHVRSSHSEPGISDLIGYIKVGKLGVEHNPVPVYIEAKRPGGRWRPSQIRFIEEKMRDGCVAFFAESLDQAVEQFNRMGYPVPRIP